MQRNVKSGSADDAAFVLGNAETVVIVPGYGLAVARAQHAVKELAEKLKHKGITGMIAFDQNGDLIDGTLTLYTYKNGKREMIAVTK